MRASIEITWRGKSLAYKVLRKNTTSLLCNKMLSSLSGDMINANGMPISILDMIDVNGMPISILTSIRDHIDLHTLALHTIGNQNSQPFPVVNKAKEVFCCRD